MENILYDILGPIFGTLELDHSDREKEN